MKKQVFIMLLLLAAITGHAAIGQILPKPADIGPEWQGGTGVVIEDLNNPPAFFAQSMGKVIEQYQSIGVNSMANLAYRKRANLMHQVELKIFEFDSVKNAVLWKRKKYGYDNWQAHYASSKEGAMTIFDSLEITKRIVFYQNYWVTASVLNGEDDHLLFLDHVIELIRTRHEN